MHLHPTYRMYIYLHIQTMLKTCYTQKSQFSVFLVMPWIIKCSPVFQCFVLSIELKFENQMLLLYEKKSNDMITYTVEILCCARMRFHWVNASYIFQKTVEWLKWKGFCMINELVRISKLVRMLCKVVQLNLNLKPNKLFRRHHLQLLIPDLLNQQQLSA